MVQRVFSGSLPHAEIHIFILDQIQHGGTQPRRIHRPIQQDSRFTVEN
jgi:hypothetical protein